MTTLTATDRALDVFRNRPPVPNPVDWMANQLLALAIEYKRLSIRIVPSAAGDGPVLELADAEHRLTTSDAGPLRLFRTLLARLARMAEVENGTAFNPYGGTIHFNRAGADGRVRLDVEIANTTQLQSLVIVRGLPGDDTVEQVKSSLDTV